MHLGQRHRQPAVRLDPGEDVKLVAHHECLPCSMWSGSTASASHVGVFAQKVTAERARGHRGFGSSSEPPIALHRASFRRGAGQSIECRPGRQ